MLYNISHIPSSKYFTIQISNQWLATYHCYMNSKPPYQQQILFNCCFVCLLLYSPYHFVPASLFYKWIATWWIACIIQDCRVLCKYLIRRQLKQNYRSRHDVADLGSHTSDSFVDSYPIQKFIGRDKEV